MPLVFAPEAPGAGFEVPLLRVDVGAEDGRVRFSRADAPTRPLRAPLVLGPTQRVAYAVPEQPWTLRSLLANPMYLIMGLMAVMMFVMPRLMENIDPEVRRSSYRCLSPQRLTRDAGNAGAEADAGADGQGRHAGAVAGAFLSGAPLCGACSDDVACAQEALMGDKPPPPKKKALEAGAAPSSSSGGGSSKKKH